MHFLQEQADVFVDACVADHRGQLLFVSALGRDTSIQQFMARLHVSPREGGVDELSVIQPAVPGDPVGKPRLALRVLVGDAKRLTKLTGRMPRTGLLGNLVHAWIFDPALLEADHSSHAAWLVQRRSGALDKAQTLASADLPLDDIWCLVRELSPVPLMDHWCLQALQFLRSRSAIQVSPAVGEVVAIRVEIPEGFDAWVSDRIREGQFTEQVVGAVGAVGAVSDEQVRPARLELRRHG